VNFALKGVQDFMQTNHWEHFEHEADIGVRGIAVSLDEAFEQVAIAMSAVITDLERIEPRIDITINCAAPDKEILLLEWLDSLIYEMAVRKMLFNRFNVTIKGTTLKAIASGETINIEKHHPAVEIKGATFTELKVNQDQNGLWVAQCVVDV
jgi:tRNA nucleotidyltransferase (CCA-adding enzyme)